MKYGQLEKILIGFCCLLISFSSFSQSKESKPNIVFILVDDLGWMDIGANGSSFYETPNVDKLAKEGVRFTRAYAASPVCSHNQAQSQMQ